MRQVINPEQLTPFGHFIRQYGPPSSCVCVSNLDYIVQEYKKKLIMLVEEKQSGGNLHTGQRLLFKDLERIIIAGCSLTEYEYRGFHVVRFSKNATMPGPGMTLNDEQITVEQLVRFLHFESVGIMPFDFSESNQ